MKVYTIGFTKTSAESFFNRIQKAGVKRIIDVRLNNVSQLAGFAKKNDLCYFLDVICRIAYLYRPELAPTKELLAAFKKKGGQWADYESNFLELLASRRIDQSIRPDEIDGACLLCSEDKPQHCHRRLVVEYLKEKWGQLDIIHL